MADIREKQETAPTQEELETLKQRYAEICREYQRNQIDTASLQTEIIKGVRQGESIYKLFLTAVKAIAVMSNSQVIYEQVSKDVPIVYGVGLAEHEPLENEIGEVQRRLGLLTRAVENETDSENRGRLEAAVKAHQQRIRYLQGLEEERKKQEAQEAQQKG